jgi:septal ring factor EnvC (AmiA/AmiB activator)
MLPTFTKLIKVILLLSVLVLFVAFSHVTFGAEKMYLISETELTNLEQIQRNYVKLQADYSQLTTNSKESLQKSEKLIKELQIELTAWKEKINYKELLLSQSNEQIKSLEQTITTLDQSLKQLEKEVRSRLLKAKIKSFLVGLVGGFAVGRYVLK